MAETSRIIRAVRLSGTRETKLTVGGFQTSLTKWEALHLLKDLFVAVWGADFNSMARQRSHSPSSPENEA